MNTYETTFIVDPGMDEAKVNEEIERLSKWIAEAGGEVIDVQRWGKRRLAYEINKKRDGVYTHVLHKSPGTVIKEIERRMGLNESIMRVLTVLHVPHTPPPADDHGASGGEQPAAQSSTASAPAAPAKATSTATAERG